MIGGQGTFLSLLLSCETSATIGVLLEKWPLIIGGVAQLVRAQVL